MRFGCAGESCSGGVRQLAYDRAPVTPTPHHLQPMHAADYACGDIDDSQSLPRRHNCTTRMQRMHVPAVVSNTVSYLSHASPRADAGVHAMHGQLPSSTVATGGRRDSWQQKLLDGWKVREGCYAHPPSPHTPGSGTAAQVWPCLQHDHVWNAWTPCIVKSNIKHGADPQALFWHCTKLPVWRSNKCCVGALIGVQR